MPIDGVEGRQQPDEGAPRATVADTRDLLRQAELDGERVGALFRLVIYAAALFVVTVEADAVRLSVGDGAAGHGMRMADQGMLGNFMLFQAFPITIVGLSAMILFVTGQRTRGLLVEPIDQTYRAAKLSRYFSPKLTRQVQSSPVVSSALLAAGGDIASELRWRSLAGQPLKEHDGPVDAFALVSEGSGGNRAWWGGTKR